MATLPVAPTQLESPWCLKKEGPANRGEMEPLTSTTPSTMRSSCIEKNRHTLMAQMTAADSESNAKNCSASPEQFGA